MVDRITEHSGTTRNRRKFFVFWEGYPDEPTWEPETNLTNTTIYLEYVAKLPVALPPTARRAAKAKAVPRVGLRKSERDAVSSLQQVRQ